MLLKVIPSVWCVVGLLIVVAAMDDPEDSSCTRLDFDQATLSTLRNCEYVQEFIVKRYDESNIFDPFRPEAEHYLSNRWQGLSCGETVDTYSFNEETELRMAYSLVFDSGATLEVRVYDEDRIDADNKPTLVEAWHTDTSTEGWGMFREKLNKTVKKARIQIEANINAGSDLAIEYLTIFNYEVETDECTDIDEFTTTTVTPSSTEAATSSTAAIATETTTQPPVTTTTHETTVTTTDTAVPSTTLSTVDDEASSTVTTDTTTTTTTATTTVSSSTTEIPTTTTTNAPRDDTSIEPSSSTEQQPPESSSSEMIVTTTTTESAPSIIATLSRKQWLWMTLTAVFAILFVLATSVAIYLWLINRHLERISARLLDQLERYPCKKT